MKLVFRTFLFWLFVPVLALCAWYSITSQTSGDSLSTPYLKKRLDIVIAGHAKQILKYMIHHKMANSDVKREEIYRIQTQFLCYLHRGSWVVRGQHEIRYDHDPDCLASWHPLQDLNLTQVSSRLCSYVSGKKISLIGPRVFYHTQTLLLEALALHKTHPSKGPESGNHYFICEDSSASLTSPRNASLHRDSRAALTRLSFSLSDTLFHPQYLQPWTSTQPLVDSRTGIRLYSSNWLSDTHRAQILLFNKGPLPAPAWTFNGHTGNWSFTEAIPQMYFGLHDADTTQKIVNAALHVIFQVYIPGLLQALHTIPTRKVRRIFVGPWYQQPVCTNAGLSPKFRIVNLIWETNEETNSREVDPWTLYYNAQVYIIDQVLPVILPYFNITYIPMTFPLIPDHHVFGGPDVRSRQKDCLRPASNQAAGRALQLALIKMLVYLLQDK